MKKPVWHGLPTSILENGENYFFVFLGHPVALKTKVRQFKLLYIVNTMHISPLA